jgi:hypothetical protein
MDIKRKEEITKILKIYKEPDVPDKIIKMLKNKYYKLKYCNYIHSEEINEGDLIYTVSLDFKKLSVPAKCIKIKYSENKTIQNILLVNNNINKYWKIKPTKYYIFHIPEKSTIRMNELIDLIYLKNKNLKKK